MYDPALAKPCPFRKSDPLVTVMQSGQDRHGSNGPEALNFSPERRILVQSQMRARPIVIQRIQFKDPPQVLLAKDQHMIQAGSRVGWSRSAARHRHSAMATSV